MMMTRSISALEGRGVGLGVKVGAGVNVAVMVAVGVEVLAGVAVDVEVEVAAANSSIGCGADPVGEGTGGRELPQILGRLPQPERIKASRMMVRRFRGMAPTYSVHGSHGKHGIVNWFYRLSHK
jgi:hypothetical protein